MSGGSNARNADSRNIASYDLALRGRGIGEGETMSKTDDTLKFRYKIMLADDLALRLLLSELNHWCVNPQKYTVEGLSVFTSNFNVVDVATETFMGSSGRVKILDTKEKSDDADHNQ